MNAVAGASRPTCLTLHHTLRDRAPRITALARPRSAEWGLPNRWPRHWCERMHASQVERGFVRTTAAEHFRDIWAAEGRGRWQRPSGDHHAATAASRRVLRCARRGYCEAVIESV